MVVDTDSIAVVISKGLALLVHFRKVNFIIKQQEVELLLVDRNLMVVAGCIDFEEAFVIASIACSVEMDFVSQEASWMMEVPLLVPQNCLVASYLHMDPRVILC